MTLRMVREISDVLLDLLDYCDTLEKANKKMKASNLDSMEQAVKDGKEELANYYRKEAEGRDDRDEAIKFVRRTIEGLADDAF